MVVSLTRQTKYLPEFGVFSRFKIEFYRIVFAFDLLGLDKVSFIYWEQGST